jgi:hypothetical protein
VLGVEACVILVFRMDVKKLYRFMLTVRKNYRPVPYHNWPHGWHVAHSIFCMFRLIQQSPHAHFADPIMVT